MGTVLDQVTSESVDADHIRRRVDAWEVRLQGLYTEIVDWFPDEWEARQGALVEMHEALMRKFGIGAKRIPTLELLNRAVDVVRVELQTMWTIGANGQLVLRRDDHCYLIVDRTENFERPDWQSARAEQRCDRETVTRDWHARLVEAHPSVSDLQAIGGLHEQLDNRRDTLGETASTGGEGAVRRERISRQKRINDQVFFVLAWGQLEADRKDACREAIAPAGRATIGASGAPEPCTTLTTVAARA